MEREMFGLREHILMHKSPAVLEQVVDKYYRHCSEMRYVGKYILLIESDFRTFEILEDFGAQGLIVLQVYQEPITLDDVLDKLSRLYKITPHAKLLLNAEEQYVLYSSVFGENEDSKSD